MRDLRGPLALASYRAHTNARHRGRWEECPDPDCTRERDQVNKRTGWGFGVPLTPSGFFVGAVAAIVLKLVF